MGLYTFTLQQLKDIIDNKASELLNIKIGFIQRHSDNKTELLAKASELCLEPIEINARHIFFNYNGSDAIFCIEDYGKIDVSEQCVNRLLRVKNEFDDDVIDDETTSWKLLVFDDGYIYELGVISIELLTNEEEAIIKCRGCKRKLG